MRQTYTEVEVKLSRNSEHMLNRARFNVRLDKDTLDDTLTPSCSSLVRRYSAMVIILREGMKVEVQIQVVLYSIWP